MQNLEKKYIKKILTIASTGIGNVILYTPLVKSLKENFPSAKISIIVGSKEASEVLSGSDLVDEIIILEKKKMTLKKYLTFLLKIRREKFDMVITSFLDKSFKVGLFSFLTGAKYRVGFDNGFQKIFYNYRTKIDSKKHEVEYNLDLLRTIGLSKLNSELFFHISEEDIETAKNFLNKNNISENDFIVGIHPGSGEWKRWPKEKYAELCNELIKLYNAKVIVFGGKEDINVADFIVNTTEKKVISACGIFSLKQTAALIKMCKVFVSNDTCPMHIAATVKVPVIAIFGPTLYWKMYPWNTKHIIVKKDLPCVPCYNYRKVICKNNRLCLTSITVEEVLHAVEKIQV
ncbi:MAG: lipopolysaccharide heptosyltransferase II [Endomicrobiia bacterium]